MSLFRSSILRSMPPQLYERVDKSEPMNPDPILIIRNTFPTHLHTFFIFSIILFRKYKNIFTCLHTQSKLKNTFTAFYGLHISLVFLSSIIFILLHCYLFYAYHIFILLTFTPYA
jgi:hypothetical protein